MSDETCACGQPAVHLVPDRVDPERSRHLCADCYARKRRFDEMLGRFDETETRQVSLEYQHRRR